MYSQQRIHFAFTLCLLAVLLWSGSAAHADIDFNTDGLPDLLFQNQSTGQIAYWGLAGSTYLGGSAVQSPLSADWQLRDSADLNADGKSDLIYQSVRTGQVVVWYMDGPTMAGGGALSLLPAPGYQIVGTGDFNGDGNPDLVFQNSTTGQAVIWFLNGLTVTGGATLVGLPSSTDPNNAVVGVADFNGDGYPDLVFQNHASHIISFVAMQGTQVTGRATLPLAPYVDYNVVGLGDFNGDGNPDLLFQNARTGQLTYWLLNRTTYSGWGNLPAPSSLDWNVAGVRTVSSHIGSPVSFPVAVTGFNRDVIFENSSPTSAQSFDDGTATWLADGVQGYAGLPAGVFSSRLTNSVTMASTRYKLQRFADNNVMMIDTTSPQGTLTLVTPQRFRSLSIAAVSSGARFTAGIGTLTLNFQDGSTSAAINYNARDWWGEGANDDPNRIFQAGVYRTVNTGTNLPTSSVQVDTSYTKFNLYETTIDLANVGGVDYSHKILQSVTFNVAVGAQRTGIFALSGSVGRP